MEKNCGPWITLKVLDGDEKPQGVLRGEAEETSFLHWRGCLAALLAKDNVLPL